MELKEGMYVRTPLGITKYLGKHKMFDGSIAENLHEFDKLDEELWSGDLYGVVFDCDLEDIVLKSSPNIIDLIEEHDFVQMQDRGDEFYEIAKDYKGKLSLRDIGWNEYEELDETNIPEIVSIITHEQMEQMKYNLESEVN